MTQTLALFIDAYRELNARKLFWITLIVTALFIGAFALVGVGPKGLTIAGFDWDVPMAGTLYKLLLRTVLLDIWLTWAATILALVSTAGIFPDMLAGGAIELFVARPLSRLRLFLTKYMAGLLFVTLQALLFSAGAFLVMGWRAHEWNTDLFLAVPVVVCFFSYLFAVLVLLGIVTRSTVAALLLTIVVWLGFFAIGVVEPWTAVTEMMMTREAALQHAQAAGYDAELKRLEDNPTVTNAFGLRSAFVQHQRDEAQKAADDSAATARKWGVAHSVVYSVATVLPKTGATINLLDRRLFSDAEVQQLEGNNDDPPAFSGRRGDDTFRERRSASREIDKMSRARSPQWIIGTSLLFEAVVLAGAAAVFCRRDY